LHSVLLSTSQINSKTMGDTQEEELRAKLKLKRNKQRRLSNNNNGGRSGDNDDKNIKAEMRDEFGRAINSSRDNHHRRDDNERSSRRDERRSRSSRDNNYDDDRRRSSNRHGRDERRSNRSSDRWDNDRNNDSRNNSRGRRSRSNSRRGSQRRSRSEHSRSMSRSRSRSQPRSRDVNNHSDKRRGGDNSYSHKVEKRHDHDRHDKSDRYYGDNGRDNGNNFNRDRRQYDDRDPRWNNRGDRYNNNYDRRPPPPPHHYHQREPIPPPYKAGDVVSGVISRIEGYGAFVTLDAPNNVDSGSHGRGGHRGLIHVSALRPPDEGRVEHPSEVVQMGQQVKVLVLEIVPPMEGGDDRRGGGNFKIRVSLAAIDPSTGTVRTGFSMPPPRGNPSTFGGGGGRGGPSNNMHRDGMLQNRAEERRRLRLNQDDGVHNKAAWQTPIDEMKSHHRGILPPSILVWDLPPDEEMDDFPQKEKGKSRGTKRSRSSSSQSSSSSTSSSTSSSSSSSSSSSASSSYYRRRRRKRSSRRSNRKRSSGRSSNRRRHRRDYSDSSSSSSSDSDSSASSRSRSDSRDRKKPRRSTDEDADSGENRDREHGDGDEIDSGNKGVDPSTVDMPLEEEDLREAQDFKKAVQGHRPNGSDSESDDDIGPQPLSQANTNNNASAGGAASNAYGSALLPGEGEALAQYVQQNLRIPRRGEIGYSSTDIDSYEKSGYVMSGSRHARMNAVRIRKENQIYSAEEQRALALITLEENQQKEQVLLQDFREMLQDKLKDGGEKADNKDGGD